MTARHTLPGQALPLIEYRHLTSDAELSAAFHLRYDCYLQEGAIAATANCELADRFDTQPNTFVFGIYLEGRLASSIRLHVLSDRHRESPTYQAFEDLIEPYLESGKILIDPTRFFVDQTARRKFPYLAYVTLRLPFVAAGFFRASHVLAAVRSEHMAFYKRVLRCSKIGEPRPYNQLIKRLGLMLVDYEEQRDEVLRRYPIFSTEASDLILFEKAAGQARMK